jgi:O-antigen/teichoic acid export membrane protein
LNFPISSIGSTHETLLIKQLAFNRKFIPDFAQALSKGIVSIVLAVLGFGPWSLIIGQLSGTLVSDIVDWILVPWRPTFTIVMEAARSLLRFGLPMVGVDIVAMIVLNVDYLLVGRYLGPAPLGVYTLAFRIPELVVLEFCAIVASVVFPVFTKIRDDPDALRRGFQQTARYVALVTVPIGLGVALLARPFLLVVFGQKWLEAAPVMTAISIYALLLSLGFNAGDVYKAQGKPGVLTQISLLKAAILIPALYWAVTGPASLIAVGWVQATVAFVGSVIYLGVAMRMLHLSPGEMLSSFLPALTAGAALALAVGAVLYIGRGAPDLVVLIGGTLAGGLAYIGCLWLLNRELVLELWALGRSVLLRK